MNIFNIVIQIEYHIDNHLVGLTDDVRFLRILIVDRMTWKEHINYVSNNLRTVYFLIYKASSISDDKSLKLITYHSLTQLLTIVVKHGETRIQCLYLLQQYYT